MRSRQLWWIGIGIALFLVPEIAGGRRLGGTWLEAWSYPLWAFIHDRLWQGSLPLWQPYIDCGLSLVGSPAVGLCYPPNWLVWLFKPSTAIPLAVALHLMLAGCGAARLLHHLGCRWPAALVTGLAVALGGTLPALAGQPERLEVLAWWPWLLLALEDERGLMASLVVGLQSLAGDPQGVLLSGVAATVWCLFRHADREDSLTTLSRVSGIAVLGLCLGAAAWLPYAETYRHSLRFQGGVLNPPHLALHALLGQVLPLVPVTALALAGLAVADRKRFGLSVGASWAVVAVALVGARGLAGPIGWLASWLKGRAHLIAMSDHAPHGWQSVMQIVWGVLSQAVAGLAGDEPLRWISVVGLAVLLVAGIGLNRFFAQSEQLGWSVALLHVIVCVVMGRLILPSAHGPWPADPDALALLSPIDGTNFRYSLAGSPDPRLYNDGTLKQARSAVGFTPMAPADTMDVLNWAAYNRLVDHQANEHSDLQELLANGHRITSSGLQDAVLGCLAVKLALDTPSPSAALHLRTLEHTRERFHLADHSEVYGRTSSGDVDWQLGGGDEAPSPDDLNTEMLAAMAQSPPSNEVLLDQVPDMGDTTADDHLTLSGHCELMEDEPDHVVVDVDSNRKALLVVADAYDEGWQATVNGEPHRVYPADGMLRAVIIPAGRSRVDWTFDPPAWAVGWRLSLGSLVAWVFMLWREATVRGRKKSPPEAPPDMPAALPESLVPTVAEVSRPAILPAPPLEKPTEDPDVYEKS